MTAERWIKTIEDLKEQFGFEHVFFDLIKIIGEMMKDNAFEHLHKEAGALRTQEVDTTGNLFG